ncbi:hypothetical protein GGE65_004895 [Skermanella aerolata]|jgi:hypothetical protein
MTTIEEKGKSGRDRSGVDEVSPCIARDLTRRVDVRLMSNFAR